MERLEGLGCKLNNVSVDELFSAYYKLGFIYPQKQEELKNYFIKIKDNWLKAVSSKHKIIKVLTHTIDDDQSFATVCYWPSTSSTALVQHAVSSGKPISSRAVILGALSEIDNGEHPYRAIANYFRPTNKWSMKLLAKQYEVLGPNRCSLNKLSYLKLPKSSVTNCSSSAIEIVKYDRCHQAALAKLAKKIRGNAYVVSEDLDRFDLHLNELRTVFHRNALSYEREIYLAYQKGAEEPVVAIIANRAPLGFNFSFLENKCEILVDNDNVGPAQLSEIINKLLPIINLIYQTIELPYIPIITDEGTGKLLITYGAEFMREYMQCIWLKEAFPDSYRYIESVYQPVFDIYQKKLLARR